MDLYDLCVWFNVFYHFCCNTVFLYVNMFYRALVHS